jgi:hypothetical protein
METEIEIKANKTKMNKHFITEDGGRGTKFQNLELTEAQQQKSGTGTKERRKDSEQTINTGHSTGKNHGLTKQGSYNLHSILALGRFSLLTLGYSSGAGSHFKRLLSDYETVGNRYSCIVLYSRCSHKDQLLIHQVLP